jgi:hypothetical protein
LRTAFDRLAGEQALDLCASDQDPAAARAASPESGTEYEQDP